MNKWTKFGASAGAAVAVVALGLTVGPTSAAHASGSASAATTAWKGCKQKTFTDSINGALGSVGAASVRYAWCWKGNRITSYRIVSESTRVTRWGAVRGYYVRAEGDWYKSGGKNTRHVTRMHRVKVGRDIKVNAYDFQTRDHNVKLLPAGKSSHWVTAKNH